MCDLSMWNLCVQRKIFYYDVQLEILLKKKKRKKDTHDKRYRVWKHRPKKKKSIYSNSYILNVNDCLKDISSKIINIQLWIVIQNLKSNTNFKKKNILVK